MSKKRKEIILDSSWPPMIILIGIGIMFYSYPFEEAVFKYFGESRLFVLIPIGLGLFSIYRNHKGYMEISVLTVLAISSIAVLSAIIGDGGTLYDSGVFGNLVLNQILSLNGCRDMNIIQNGKYLFDCTEAKVSMDMIKGILAVVTAYSFFKLLMLSRGK